MVAGRAAIRDLEISKVAAGTWALGGGRDWGKSDDAQSEKAVLSALDLGINLIDTAPIYGLYHAETLLAPILKGRRDKIILSTKCGLKPGPRAVQRDLSPASVRKELEDSLKRLGTDYIDLYLIHWPDRNTPLQDTLAEMERLKKEGKIRQTGVCNFSADLLREALKHADIAAVQNEYSYLRLDAGLEVFDLCKKHNIAFMAYGTLAGGVLSGKYKKEPNIPCNDARSFFYKCYKGEAFKRAAEAAEKFALIGARHNAGAAQAAINWTLAEPAVTCAIAGIRTPGQARDAAQALSWRLSKEDLELLK